jgi:hypothetical protein
LTEPQPAAEAIGLAAQFIPSAAVVKSFLWGCAGSVFVEIALICYYRQTAPQDPLPGRYQDSTFKTFRGLLVLVSGAVVVAHGIVDHPWLAIHLGAATPALMLGLASELERER